MDLVRILLVEDNENDIELALSVFEENNLANEVVVVRNGVEALDFLYRRGAYATRQDVLPAVVLLDLKLPLMDGLEVLKQLKSDPAMRTLPVVMLTSSREEIDMATSYHTGVNAYVVKPIDFADFVTSLRELGLFWGVVNQPPPDRPGPPAE